MVSQGNQAKTAKSARGSDAKVVATKKRSDAGTDSFTSKLKVRGGSGSTTK